MKNLKKYLYPGLMVLFAIVFLVSAGILVDYFVKSGKQQDQYDDLSNMVQQNSTKPSTTPSGSTEATTDSSDPTAPTGPASSHVEVTHPVTGKPVSVLREYAEVFLLNSDMAGWIRVDGTNIDYPVMQTPDRDSYFLKRNFYKEYSKHGCIYTEEQADLQKPSDNVTIYGHNMSDGSMFAALHKYRDASFYKENPTFTFDTIYEHHTYQIIAVFDADFRDKNNSFYYHIFIDGTEKEFDYYVSECHRRALYDTGVTAEYGDKLITLSTCDKDYSNDYGRFVVVAKRIS